MRQRLQMEGAAMAVLRNRDCEGDKSQKTPKDALCSQTTLHLTSIKIGYTQRKQCLWDTNPISGPGREGRGEKISPFFVVLRRKTMFVHKPDCR